MKTRKEFEEKFGKQTDAEWERKEKMFKEIEQYLAEHYNGNEESK